MNRKNLIQESVHVDMPAKIPGIELESEIEIPGSAVTMLMENLDQEMTAAAVNVGFINVSTAIATPAVKIIVIDDDLPDGDVVSLQECKVDPNDVSESKIVDPDQEDAGVADNDVGNTQEGVNPTQLEDNHEDFGSAANPDGQRRSHRITRQYHNDQIHSLYCRNPSTCSAQEVC